MKAIKIILSIKHQKWYYNSISKQLTVRSAREKLAYLTFKNLQQ